MSSDCYLAAQLAFSSLWGFVFAIIFLLYYTLASGANSQLPSLLLATFVTGTVWLLIVLATVAFRAFVTFRLMSSKKATTLFHQRTKPLLMQSDEPKDEPKYKAVSLRTKDKAVSLGAWFDQLLSVEWILRGIMWLTIYLLWASGPLLINPLKQDFDLESVSISGLLTASNYRA